MSNKNSDIQILAQNGLSCLTLRQMPKSHVTALIATAWDIPIDLVGPDPSAGFSDAAVAQQSK